MLVSKTVKYFVITNYHITEQYEIVHLVVAFQTTFQSNS